MTRNDQRKNIPVKKIVLLVFLVFLLAVLVWGGMNYFSFKKAINKMNEHETTTIPPADKVPHQDPFSVLLLGIDEREHDSGRTDTMIVVTVNPDLGTIKMLSIPRDSRVEIVGNNTVEKINHAYARGGIAMSIDTVEELLSIPIDYYVAINMEGFLSIIDVLGGIEVENDMDLSVGSYSFPKGGIRLSGEEALIFSRIRYEDPRGDFGRQLRQKQLVEAILAKSSNPAMLLKLDDIFDILGDNVKMNFTGSQIINLQKLYSKLNGDIQQLQFQEGQGQRIDGYWYYILNEEEVNKLSSELLLHLEENEAGTTP
ncbi:LCP family glycopolymer transferase [Lysinibacillus sp. 54212]|uniref:LCP family glycopolymer transferase n=1 Tax=Lysinibacillus sp. 54212 TaxID=3119829 RepID=UPI002FCA6669